MNRPRGFDSFGISLVIACFLFSLHRALTRSVTHDEALTWFLFVSKGLAAIFDPGRYDTNNHVLHSILCDFSTGLLGPSHLGLRLPALAGCLIYLFMAFLVCRRVFGQFPGAVALGLLCLNPVVFDFFSQARGYSLALAFFMLAYYEFLLILTGAFTGLGLSKMRGRILGASLLMGLAVATQPYFSFACSALAGSFLILAPIAAGAHHRPCGGLVARLFALACLPGAGIVWLTYFNLRPAMRTGRWNLAGLATIWDSAREIVEYALGLNGIEQGVRVSRPEMHIPVLIALACIAALILGAGIFSAWRLRVLLRSAAPSKPSVDLVLCHAGATFTLMIVLQVFAARVWGTHYPVARLGMPLMICLILWLACTATHPAWRRLSLGRVPRLLAVSGTLILLWQSTLVWPSAWYTYEADTRQIAELIEKLARRVGEPLAVDTDWILAPSINFYRQTLHMECIDKFQPNGMRSVADGYDLHIVPDHKTFSKAGLPAFYRAPFSGVCLALGRTRDYYHEEEPSD